MGIHLRRKPHRGRHARVTLGDLFPGASRRQVVEAFVLAAGTEEGQFWVRALRSGVLDDAEEAKVNAYLDDIADRLDGTRVS